jgi:aspartyl/asparaginyl-tRNA synthetase
MERTFISDASKPIGQTIELNGFVQVIRDQKSVQFIILRDPTGLMQIVIGRSEVNSGLNHSVSSLTRESTIRVTGKVVNNPAVKLGQIELQLETLEVVALAETTLPIDVTNQTETDVGKRQDWRFLELRRPENQLIFRIQTTVEQAMRDFCLAEGFVEIHSPKLMGSPSEGGAELFTLDYFGQTASLAQSPQFFKQMAMAAGMERVFEIGPAFRAEPSFTVRHATEFTSVDIEFSWIESHFDVMEFEELWTRSVLQEVKAKHGAEIKTTFGTEIIIPELPFPKISMADAQALLRQEGYIPGPSVKEGDLEPQGEKLLCEYAQREFGHEFVFIIDYPIEIRPFYHMRYEDRPNLTKSFDLLWKSMEITTGAQLGLKNIRDVEYLHRAPNRLVP